MGGGKKVILDPPMVFGGVSCKTLIELAKVSGVSSGTLRDYYYKGSLLTHLALLEKNIPSRSKEIVPPITVGAFSFSTVSEVSEFTGLSISNLSKKLKKSREELIAYVTAKINFPEYTGNITPVQDYKGKWWPSKEYMAENYPVGNFYTFNMRLNRGQSPEAALNTPPKQLRPLVQKNENGDCIDPWGKIWVDVDEMCANYPVKTQSVYKRRIYEGKSYEDALLTPAKVMPSLNFLTTDGDKISSYAKLASVLNVSDETARKMFLRMPHQELQALIYQNRPNTTNKAYDHLGMTYESHEKRNDCYKTTIAGGPGKTVYMTLSEYLAGTPEDAFTKPIAELNSLLLVLVVSSVEQRTNPVYRCQVKATGEILYLTEELARSYPKGYKRAPDNL